LLAEKLPFAELRDEKFRQHPQWPVLAETVNWQISKSQSQYRPFKVAKFFTRSQSPSTRCGLSSEVLNGGDRVVNGQILFDSKCPCGFT
jgi:hypothetical protein